MNAAWPAIMQLGVLIGIGLVLLYLLRPRRRRVQVPYSGLWQRVLARAEARALGRNWRRWLSLLVMLGLASLLLAALAEPMWRSGQAPTHLPETKDYFAIVVDCSVSMATRDGRGPVGADGLPPSRLLEAKTAILNLLNQLEEQAPVLLISVTGHAEVRSSWGMDRSALRRAVEDLQAHDSGLDLAAGLQTAKAALQGHAHGQILVVSDGGPSLVPLADEATLGVAHLAVGPPIQATASEARLIVDDLAVEDLRVRPEAADPDRATVTVRLRNDAGRPVQARLALSSGQEAQTPEDFRNDAVLLQVTTPTLPPGQTTLSLPGIVLTGPRVGAQISGNQADFRDRLPQNDQGFAVLAQRKQLQVLLVTDLDPQQPGAQVNRFLAAALGAMDRVTVTTISADAYDPQQFSGSLRAKHGFDVAIIDHNPLPLPPGLPGLQIGMNDQVAGMKDDHYERIKGPQWRQGPEVVVRAGDHPLMHGVSFQDTNFDQVRILTTQPGDEVLAEALPHGAVMVARKEPVRTLRWGLDLLETDLPMRYALPIALGNALGWLVHEEDPVLAPLELGRCWAIETPDSGQRWQWQAPGQAPRPARMAADQILTSSEIAGIHVFSNADGQQMARATSLPPTEDPALRKPPGKVWHQGPSHAAELTPARQPNWAKLLLLAALLLAVEWWLYLRRRTV